jgi:hypothetical protein
MKNKMIFIGLIAMQPLMGCASPPATRVTLDVVDQGTGMPLSNAVVSTAFLLEDCWDKPDKYQEVKTVTDNHGQCVLEGNDLDHYFNAKVDAGGYYKSLVRVEAEKINRGLNRWEPWDPVIEVKVRKIKSPVPMVYKTISRKDIPDLNKPVGFDFELKDWTPPYGEGKKNDIVFFVSKKGYQGAECHISFSNELDGIQPYASEENLQSEYIFPYLAPTNGYAAILFKEKWYANAKDDAATNVKEDKDINYIFRVRTQVDENGNIISANYGRIKGEIRISSHGRLYFSYWFNPESNNRSLESLEKPY